MNLKCPECHTDRLRLMKQYWNPDGTERITEVECKNGHINEIIEKIRKSDDIHQTNTSSS